ncbi:MULTISPECIES: branched-chain amino acid ABC transporter permease [unclassified Spirillospora]|uniref:branched-chain amino acid ABC transporter permease n=1 Tax=unclassified Spirillospora TaxID=2642701 RepID=UPI00372106AC
MDRFVTILVAGAAVGSLYALMAFGYALVFKASHGINLAAGALVVLGGYCAYELGANGLGWSFGLASLATVAITCAGGWLAYRAIARPLLGASPDAIVVATIGFDLALRALLSSHEKWTLNSLEVGSPWTESVKVAGNSVARSDLWIIGIAAVILAVLGAAVARTRFGLNMRACAEDPEAAQAQGVSLRRNLAAVWIIAAGLAAVVGVLVGTHPRTLDQSNFTWALRALPAVVLGGMDSLTGAVLGGLLVGYAEAISSAWQPEVLGQGYQLVVPYVLMFLVLLVRPQGLLGRREVSRV